MPHGACPLYCLVSRSDPGGIRTLDPLIKSQLLYQLSYGVIFSRCKYNESREQCQACLSIAKAHLYYTKVHFFSIGQPADIKKK